MRNVQIFSLVVTVLVFSSFIYPKISVPLPEEPTFIINTPEKSPLSTDDIIDIGNWSYGDIWYIEYQSDIVYITQGYMLQILDMTSAIDPILIGELYIGYGIQSMEIADTILYIGTTYDGVCIVDVSDPTSPRKIGNIPTAARALSLCSNSTLLYVGVDDDYIEVLDVSTPSDPISLFNYTAISSSNYLWDIEIQDEIIAVANGGGHLKFLNGSNPLSLQLIKEYTGVSQPLSVHLEGTIAFVVGYGDPLSCLNITDLNSITVLDTLSEVSYGRDIQIAGNLAFSSNGGSGIYIVDVSDPTNMMILFNGFGMNGRSVYDSAVKDETLFVPDTRNGLYCLNITTPENPNIAGFHPGETIVSSIAILGDFAYLGHYTNGFSVIDVSNPLGPTKVGYWGTYSTSTVNQVPDSSRMADMEVYGEMLFAADGARDLKIFNISDPTNPSLIKSFELSGGLANGIAIGGHHAYISDRYYGLRIIDFSDPFHPVARGEFSTVTANEADVAYENETAYLVNGANTLYIINVTDSMNATSIQTMTVGNGATSVEVQENIVYVVSNNGLEIINVTNRTSPTLLTTFNDVPVADIKIDGDFAYVGFSSGVGVLNITDKLNPTLIARYNSSRTVTQISCANGRMVGLVGVVAHFFIEDANQNGIYSDYEYEQLASPPMINSIGDVEFLDDEPTAVLNWTPSDTDPAWFELFLDGTILRCGRWNESTEILSFDPNSLSIGTHTVRIVVWDKGAYSASDEAIISIQSHTVPTTTDSTSTSTDTSSTTESTSGTSPGIPTTPTTLDTNLIFTIAIVGVIIIIVVVIKKKK
ncbi:MAG: LVIVD repeat-containing protein [Promethearchaeota archaeon]